jgi:RimJ/RimL family protein N-acetyltransferase
MLNPKYVKKIGIGDDDAWIWDSFVLAEYRGGPIFWAILTEMLKSLKEKGFGRAFGTAEIKNRVSRVATTRVGFQETKLIRKIDLFSRTIYVNSRPINSDLLNIKRGAADRAG